MIQLSELKKALAFNLRELRKAKDWTQPEVAKKAGIGYRTYCSWENGDRFPNTRLLNNVLELYGVSLNRVFRKVK